MRVRGRQAWNDRLVDVIIDGERIAAVEPASDAAADLGGDDVLLAPAFIDLQVNGYKGHDFNSSFWNDQPASPEALAAVAAELAAVGTGLFCPTVVTNTEPKLVEALTALREALEQDPALAMCVPCIHLEGPFLAPEDGPRGAHPLECVVDPDLDLFRRLQEAAGGRIGIITLAPERPGAIDLIETLAAEGVICSIGHADPSVDDVERAVAAGARKSTHLGNGAHAVLPRHPNYIWAQLAEDRLTAGVIADLQHLPASVLKCFARILAGGRMALVSDAVALGGLPAGIYNDGKHEVLESGRVNLAGTPYLAGAGHLLDTCVAHAYRHTDLDEAAVIDAVTSVPAKLLGIDAETGSVEAGRRADLTLFRWPGGGLEPERLGDGPIEAVATVVGGQVRHRDEAVRA